MPQGGGIFEGKDLFTMISAVLFDLDGLLIDSEKGFYRLVLDFIGPYGGYMSLEEYTGRFAGRTLMDNVKSYIERFNLPMTPEEGFTLMANMEKEALLTGKSGRLMKGAEELLNYLKETGIRAVLASSSTEERAVSILEANRISSYFYALTCGPSVKRPKPAPDIFLEAARAAGCAPSHCLALEDSENGIRSAFAARIPVICIPDLKKPGDECRKMAAAVLPSLDLVIPYIEAHRL